jgi:uncharacterized phage protein gp47/JayE
MALSLQNFATMVQNMAAAVQGAASQLIDLTIGSTLRAILEATASVSLWLQYLILIVLQGTRLATSAGTQVDTFGADFGFTRLPATYATGAVTFSRFTATNSALIPIGAQVRTADGTQTFAVTEDTTNSLWSASLNGYLIPATVASGTVPVIAVNAGTQGNIVAGAINLIVGAISGLDTVTNALAYTNGANAESDAAFRSRFVNFINSRARATLAAVTNAVLSVQQGLTCQIVSNVDTAGNFLAGNFVAYVDDGTGYPSSPLLAEVSAAVDAVRGLTISYNIQPPTVISAAVVMTIVAAPGYTSSNLTGPVATALTAFINGLGMGVALPYSRLAQVAYGVTGVANVTGVTLNSGTADIGGAQGDSVHVGSLTINPG